MCDKRRTGQWGNPVSCFFAPEKWKFPIPSAYNTGRVSFQTRSERMIIMTKGIVKIKKTRNVLLAGLTGDIIGTIASVEIWRILSKSFS